MNIIDANHYLNLLLAPAELDRITKLPCYGDWTAKKLMQLPDYMRILIACNWPMPTR
jgi:hypothetical protein